jgi:1,6-anhydro-N-acetylmuramate kinase
MAKGRETIQTIRAIGLMSGTSTDGFDIGARNKTLLRELADRLPCPVVLAETFGWSSDAMEAQAFAYLAARREKNLPITFPLTTRVDKPLEGGVIAEPREREILANIV